MRHIGLDERRAGLVARHLLAPGTRAADVVGVARSVVALHATDPATVHLSVLARSSSPSVADVERSLYDDRTLIRVLGMRRTMFVLPVELWPVVQAACTEKIATAERKKLVQHLSQGGVADAERWLREVSDATVEALAGRGEALATELSHDVPLLKTRLTYAEGKAYGGEAAVTPRVLFVLAAEGRIVRGRPRGSWISSQYRWAPASTWLPAHSPGRRVVDVVEAQAELARRWLAGHGPGTAADLKWWTGWTMGETRRALTAVGAVEVDIGGAAPGFVSPDHSAPVPAPPSPALLPALDPAVMGWTERDWFLGPHKAALFDRTGNPGPTVWWDGRVVGGWAQRKDGEIAVRLLEDAGAEAESAVRAEAARVSGWLGDVRVTPRFRTPLERELVS